MSMQQIAPAPVVRKAGEGDKRWFFGGGEWTWKVGSAESGGGLSVVEVVMEKGKCTPLHSHPIDESLWLLEGAVRYHIDGENTDLATGDFVMVPAEVPHAFLVLSDQARILTIQTSCDCEAFYLGASEPLDGSARETDFARIAQSGAANGGITLLGPPPF